MKKHIVIKHAKPEKTPHNWKIRSVVVLSMFVLVIFFVLMLLYSYLGLKLTVFTLNKLIPELKIERVDGSLNNLQLQKFSLELDGVTVKIGDASLSLSGLCLLQSRICIKNFDANNIMVKVNTDEIDYDDDEPEEEDPNNRWLLKMPLPIELEKTHLTQVDVYVDDMQFGMSDFTGKAIWVNEKLYVYPSVAQNLKAIFADSPKNEVKSIKNQYNTIFNETISLLFREPLIDSLPEVQIPLDVNVESLKGNNWLLHIGGQDYRFTRTTIQTEMINNHIMLKKLSTEAKSPYANGLVLGSGEIILGKDWPITTNIKIKTEQDDAEGRFVGKLLGTSKVNIKITGLNQLDFIANVNFTEKYLPIMANFSGEHFRWPMTNNPQYQFNHFAFSLDGSVKKYKLLAKSAFQGNDLPDTEFDLFGNGTHEEIIFDRAYLKFPQGDIDVKGKLNWAKGVQWDLSTKINDVDLINELPSYPTKLQGQIETRGQIKNDTWQIDLNEITLDGSVNNDKLFAKGGISINSENLISAHNFNIVLGKNEITANGSTEKDELISQVNLPSLSLMSEDLVSSIYGDIKISGPLTKPNIKTDLKIADLSWKNNIVKNANLVADIHYQDQFSGKISIMAQQVELLHETINQINLVLEGNQDNHTLTANVQAQAASLSSQLIGQFDQKSEQWAINIPQTRLQFGQNNIWELANPLQLSYDMTKQIPTINQHCWLNENASICLDKTFSMTSRNQTTVTLKNIDLAKLPISGNGDTELAGHFDGKASLEWFENQIPSVHMNITSKDIYIQHAIASQMLPIPFDLFSINADFNQKQAKLNWEFSLNEFGKLYGNLIVDDPTRKKKLSGQLGIENLSLSIINPLLQNDDHAKGAINSKLNFSGTLLDPAVKGNIDVNSSEIVSNQLPADITSGIMGINFYGRSSSLKGILKTKAGDVNITGKADWNTLDKWNAIVKLKGAATEISVQPILKLTLIPDVKVEANEDEINLSGSIDIPKGNIRVESLPKSTIDVSYDEVLLDKNKQPIEQKRANMKINSKLEIIVGEQVNIDAFGLNAALKGKLLLQQNNQGLGLNGQISIPSGRFHAYGQDLLIRKGDVTFSGLVEQPMLNIEAIRNPESIEDNVTAGIRVIGTIDDAKVDVFSEPTMSNQKALSYLLNGKGLDSSEISNDTASSTSSTGDTSSNNDKVTELLIGFGASQGGKYLGSIGNFFGIKNLSVDTKGSGDASQFVVSGYLFPDLQLKYGVGIFDSLANFTLRYRLIPQLYLEAITGTDQVINFLYQFEF